MIRVSDFKSQGAHNCCHFLVRDTPGKKFSLGAKERQIQMENLKGFFINLELNSGADCC